MCAQKYSPLAINTKKDAKNLGGGRQKTDVHLVAKERMVSYLCCSGSEFCHLLNSPGSLPDSSEKYMKHMIGDVNLFFNDPEDDQAAEINIMIADQVSTLNRAQKNRELIITLDRNLDVAVLAKPL